MMTSPWSSLDAATGDKKLYLEPDLATKVDKAFTRYEKSLQTLIDDALDETTGFGTTDNPLAKLMSDAFNSRGAALTTYLKAQLSETQGLVKTARDAATAFQANEK
jgi:hypothetical protein